MKVKEYKSYMMRVKQFNQWYALYKPLFDKISRNCILSLNFIKTGMTITCNA